MLSSGSAQRTLSRSSSCGRVWPRATTFAPVRSSCRPSVSGAQFAAIPELSAMASISTSARVASAARCHRSRRAVTVQANWGAPVDFVPAKVASKKVVSPDMKVVHINVGATIAAGYTKPGQYIQVKIKPEDKAGFFAIASSPAASQSGTLELLLKAAPGSTAEAVSALEAGAEVLVSPVQGKGFPVDKIPDAKTVLLIATGSGISPMKAVIESGILASKNVQLYYGSKDKGVTAYQDRIPEWEASGVKVHQVFSGSNKRYVQAVVQEEAAAGRLGDGKSIGVLLCGQKDMCNAATAVLTEHGVPKEAILMNF